MRYFIAITLLISLVQSTILVAQTEHIVAPNVADPKSGTPNNNHFTYVNTATTTKNKLFLFFPGTAAVPFNYRVVLKHASNLGYHAIGLMYPNADLINGNTICGNSADVNCHSNARLEVLDGKDRSTNLAVDTNNSIKKRTIKLLKYLNSKFPTENWSQYYLNDSILWEKIIVAGHSQGGGHAAMVSKIHKVDRVLMFGALDWNNPLNKSASWVAWDGATPQNKYFAFIHSSDELADFSKVQQNWSLYGMYAYGENVNIDSNLPPYTYSRTLYTTATPDNDPTKFHGSTVADAYTPYLNSTPKFQDVWTYMIDSDANTGLNALDFLNSDNFQVFPTQFNDQIYTDACLEGLNYTIYNHIGLVVQKGEMKQNIEVANHLLQGVYYLHIEKNSSTMVYKLIKE